MKFGLLIFGLLVGITAGFIWANLDLQVVLDFISQNFVGLAAIAAVFLVLAVLVLAFQDALVPAVFGVKKADVVMMAADVATLANAVASRSQSSVLPEAERLARHLMASWSAYRLRSTMIGAIIGIIGIVAGTLGTYVLIQQNTLLEAQTGKLAEQNEMFERQNLLLDEQTQAAKSESDAGLLQTVLQESSRRASDAAATSQIIREIVAEVAKAVDPTAGVKLSAGLEMQILAILPNLEAYPIAEFKPSNGERTDFDFGVKLADAVTVRHLSPERGQILQALISNNVVLDLEPWASASADFSFADMRNFNYQRYAFLDVDSSCKMRQELLEGGLEPYDLSQVTLDHADFSGADMTGVRFGIGPGFRAEDAMFETSEIEIWSTEDARLDGMRTELSIVRIGDGVQMGGTTIVLDDPSCIVLTASSGAGSPNLKGMTLALRGAVGLPVSEGAEPKLASFVTNDAEAHLDGLYMIPPMETPDDQGDLYFLVTDLQEN